MQSHDFSDRHLPHTHRGGAHVLEGNATGARVYWKRESDLNNVSE
jgi:hypothetical protein